MWDRSVLIKLKWEWFHFVKFLNPLLWNEILAITVPEVPFSTCWLVLPLYAVTQPHVFLPSWSLWQCKLWMKSVTIVSLCPSLYDVHTCTHHNLLVGTRYAGSKQITDSLISSLTGQVYSGHILHLNWSWSGCWLPTWYWTHLQVAHKLFTHWNVKQNQHLL